MNRIMKRIKTMNQKAITFGAGVLAGAVLFSGGVAIASNRSATLNVDYRDIRIVVDGAEVTPKDATGAVVEPFIFNGTTFLPVRAVAGALGQAVEWDGATHTVYIGELPTKPAEPTPAPNAATIRDRLTITPGVPSNTITLTGNAIPGKLANGKDITDENLAAMFAELEEIFPAGTIWGALGAGNDYFYDSTTFGGGSGCNSWAYMTADLLWGKGASYTTHNDLNAVKAGDIVLMRDANSKNIHWFVVRGEAPPSFSGAKKFFACDGNVGGLVSWNERYYAGTINDAPNSIIYSFY